MNWIIEPTFLGNTPLWVIITLAVIMVEGIFMILMKHGVSKREFKERKLYEVIYCKFVAVTLVLAFTISLIFVIVLLKIIALLIIPVIGFVYLNYRLAKWLKGIK